jgi:UDP-3-O-[3-hydroxymyristoyl] glucosamine N-acyltransferase
MRSLETASSDELAPLLHVRERRRGEASRAGALLVGKDCADLDRDLLVCEDAGQAMIEVLRLFRPPPAVNAGIHPTAVLGEGCVIAPSASIGAYVVVGDDTQIGEGANLGPHVTVGAACRIGAGCRLHPQVTLYDDTVLGDRVEVHSGTVIGADGHGYIDRDGYRKVPQVGRVVVENDVEIGANSAIDRATLDETRIGAGTKIDNLVQIGHNVRLGENGMLCAQVGLAGSTRIGAGVVMAGQSGIADHLEVGDGVRVGAKASVLRGVEDGRTVGGTPAIEYSQWRRQTVLLGRLGELFRRVRRLEDRQADEGGKV